MCESIFKQASGELLNTSYDDFHKYLYHMKTSVRLVLSHDENMDRREITIFKKFCIKHSMW